MGDLDDPAARPLGGMAFEFTGLLVTPLDVGDVTLGQDGLHRGRTAVTRIGTQVFRASFRWRRTLDLNGLKYGIELRHIMPIRARDDE